MESKEFQEADREAIACTNDGSTSWKEAHDQWTIRTRKELSPNAFGQRIVEKGGGKHVKPPPPLSHQSFHEHSQRSHSPAPVHQTFKAVNSSSMARTLPPIQPQLVPLPTRSPSDSIDGQRSDLRRLESTLQRVDQRVQEMEAMLHRLRHDFDMKLATAPGRADAASSSAIEMLSNTVSGLSKKAGEVDDLKVQMELLKSRINTLEAPATHMVAKHGTTTEQKTTLPYQPHPSYQPTPPLQHSSLTPGHQPPDYHGLNGSAWQTNNSLKRKPTTEGSPNYDGYGSQKRSKSTTRDSIIMYDINAPPAAGRHKLANIHAPPPPPAAAAVATAPPPPPPPPPPSSAAIPGTDGHAHPHLPPLGSLLSDHQGRDAGPGPSPLGARRPGRPRKYTSPDHGAAADGERLLRRSSGGDAGDIRLSGDQASYFNTFNGGMYDAANEERGRVIRRGSGGGNTFMGIVEKRTRQRPVRNADGILIRKDGKPDQRSISSPMNLKKVHAKKMADMDYSEHHAGSPLVEGEGHRRASNEASEEEEDYRSAVSSNSMHATPTTNHSKIMGKMFPNGFNEDRRRMDHASHLFNLSPKSSNRQMQPREEMERQEALRRIRQDETGVLSETSSPINELPRADRDRFNDEASRPELTKDGSSPMFSIQNELPTPADSETKGPTHTSVMHRESIGGAGGANTSALAMDKAARVAVAN